MLSNVQLFLCTRCNFQTKADDYIFSGFWPGSLSTNITYLYSEDTLLLRHHIAHKSPGSSEKCLFILWRRFQKNTEEYKKYSYNLVKSVLIILSYRLGRLICRSSAMQRRSGKHVVSLFTMKSFKEIKLIAQLAVRPLLWDPPMRLSS